MLKFGGVLFIVVGLFLFYFGAKNVARVIEYRYVSTVAEARVIGISDYVLYYRKQPRTEQAVVFTYKRDEQQVTDSITADSRTDRKYNTDIGRLKIGDQLVLRYPASELLFENDFKQNDQKEITTDGEYLERIYIEGIGLFLGIFFSFLGFVFYRLSKI